MRGTTKGRDDCGCARSLLDLKRAFATERRVKTYTIKHIGGLRNFSLEREKMHLPTF